MKLHSVKITCCESCLAFLCDLHRLHERVVVADLI